MSTLEVLREVVTVSSVRARTSEGSWWRAKELFGTQVHELDLR